MKFGEDSRLGVNCNCSIFPVNQYKGLVRKPTQKDNQTFQLSSSSKKKQFDQNCKIKQKISLRKGSLNMNKDSFFHGNQYQSIRKMSTPKSSKSNRKFSKNNKTLCYQSQYQPQHQNHNNLNLLKNKNNNTINNNLCNTQRSINIINLKSNQNSYPLNQLNTQDNNYTKFNHCYNQNDQKNRKIQKSSLSPHFKTASNFKNNKLQAQSNNKNSLVKKYPLKQLSSFKQNRQQNGKAFQGKNYFQPQKGFLFQNVQLLKNDKKLNEKQQKCSFTTMAGSNTGFGLLYATKANAISQMKPQNFQNNNYMLCSQHDSQHYIDRTVQESKCKLPNSYSLNDLLYKQTQSLLGQGDSVDDSQFSQVVNSNKRIQGLELINNLKHVHPFLRDDYEIEINHDKDIINDKQSF